VRQRHGVNTTVPMMMSLRAGRDRENAMQASTVAPAVTRHKPHSVHLYIQVLIAIVIGVLLGHFYPQLGEMMKPLGDGFVKLIKMLIAPIIFCTVTHGIASMEDLKKNFGSRPVASNR
jgi:L-cystine uptake protein TcyP (sodium:dicarboxylate symporter family)